MLVDLQKDGLTIGDCHGDGMGHMFVEFMITFVSLKQNIGSG
jgi:hypothetical protein